jgi:hypothetical protein
MNTTVGNMDLFNQAVMLAESLVTSERTLAAVRLYASKGIIAEARECVGDKMARLLSNRLAEILLPQARKRIVMREARKDYLTCKTFAGACLTYFDDWYADSAQPGSEIAKYDTPEKALNVLEDAIRTNNQLCTVRTLMDILQFIVDDLADRTDDLPPPPARYKIQ